MTGFIYTKHITPRLQYCTDFIGSIYNAQLQLTTDFVAYKNFEGLRINYSAEKITANEVWIQPHTILFETDIYEQSIECFDWNGLPAFFKTDGDVPFDLFAAIFYLISRYEEYLPHAKDEYGRYAHINSIAFKNNFLHLPLVNIWLKALAALYFPSFTIHYSPFTFTPTYDIDIAYSYKAKGFARNAGGLVKDVFKGKWNDVINRLSVLANRTADPFDIYQWLIDLHTEHALNPVYFFLLSAQPKGYDKNIKPGKLAMVKLIKQHEALYQTGIHPSWQSGDSKTVLQQEINMLNAITQKPVVHSRQHYVRMSFPETYSRLLAAGIQEDFSMGYGSINGFRASVASTFYWFDTEKNIATRLLIHPFCFMEANAFFEEHLTPQQAAKQLQHYHDIVEGVNGNLITIFHNHFITTQPQWLAWQQLYAHFIKVNF